MLTSNYQSCSATGYTRITTHEQTNHGTSAEKLTIEQINVILENGWDINDYFSFDHGTLLDHVFRMDNEDNEHSEESEYLATYLVERGADPDRCSDATYETPLFLRMMELRRKLDQKTSSASDASQAFIEPRLKDTMYVLGILDMCDERVMYLLSKSTLMPHIPYHPLTYSNIDPDMLRAKFAESIHVIFERHASDSSMKESIRDMLVHMGTDAVASEAKEKISLIIKKLTFKQHNNQNLFRTPAVHHMFIAMMTNKQMIPTQNLIQNVTEAIKNIIFYDPSRKIFNSNAVQKMINFMLDHADAKRQKIIQKLKQILFSPANPPFDNRSVRSLQNNNYHRTYLVPNNHSTKFNNAS